MTMPPKRETKANIKETLISVIIAFTLAFVFRGFVIEAFLIPTGSMAPTLRGAHMRFNSPQTGYQWAVDTWYKNGDAPFPVQGGSVARAPGQRAFSPQNPIEVHDPMTGSQLKEAGVPASWGDRIFVMKYLATVYDPQRFDVVVFKNPYDPTVNFIKRLLGLPGEMVALVDGDVFVRKAQPGDETAPNPWLLPGWTVARKPERAQRAMWQDLFRSDYRPLSDTSDGRRWFSTPWEAQGGTSGAWEIEGRSSYTYSGSAETALAWDNSVRSIDDRYAYNESPALGNLWVYPVSDVRVSLGVQPTSDTLSVSAVLRTRRHEFRAEVRGAEVTLRMRREGGGDWSALGQGTLPAPLAAGKVTNLDFWFVDQSLVVYCEDQEVCRGLYSWTPDERLVHTVGFGAEEALQNGSNSLLAPVPGSNSVNKYPAPKVSLEFAGGGVTLHRVCLARDVYYQPALYGASNTWGEKHSRAGQAANATHPAQNLALSPDEFFVCGDNSPASLDGRLWDSPHPWVAAIDPKIGVVHRDLLIGKAFFVYFPSPHKRKAIPVPDFGEMRYIW